MGRSASSSWGENTPSSHSSRFKPLSSSPLDFFHVRVCARWFQSRLDEQRTHAPDALARHPSFAIGLPQDHCMGLARTCRATSRAVPGPREMGAPSRRSRSVPYLAFSCPRTCLNTPHHSPALPFPSFVHPSLLRDFSPSFLAEICPYVTTSTSCVASHSRDRARRRRSTSRD